MQGISDEKKKTVTSKADVKVDQTTKDKKDENIDGQSKEEMIIDNPEDDNTAIEEREIKNEPIIEVRRSQRKRNQRIDIFLIEDFWRQRGRKTKKTISFVQSLVFAYFCMYRGRYR